MAQRRMFSLRVINSARFLKMTPSAQCLYFHLGLKADDDGVVEAFPVMRVLSSSDDDLRALVGRGFIKVLNEDLVSYVLDWNEHNLIRADRKVNSIYSELLIKVLPSASLKEARTRSDRPTNDPKTRSHTLGRPKIAENNNGTLMGRHRLGKVRLGKVSNNNIASLSAPPSEKKKTPIQVVVDYYLSEIVHASPEETRVAYPRHLRDAKALLDACDQDSSRAVNVLTALDIWARDRKLSFNIGTALKRWNEFSYVATKKETYEETMTRVQKEIEKFKSENNIL